MSQNKQVPNTQQTASKHALCVFCHVGKWSTISGWVPCACPRQSPPCGIFSCALFLIHKQVPLVPVPKHVPNLTESYHHPCSPLVNPHLGVDRPLLAGDLHPSTVSPLLSTVHRAAGEGTGLLEHTTPPSTNRP